MDIPEFVPLDTSENSGAAEVPVVLLAGYSAAEVSQFVDLIRASGIRMPAMAMIPDGVHDWKVGEYLTAIRSEHIALRKS